MVKKDQETSFQQNEERNGSIKGSVSCVICQAVYAPSQLRSDLMQASQLVLESTFMSMCHFCFRCRRPSCPDCWDDTHGLCASCDQDTHLPFRTELPPLYGTLLPPTRPARVTPEPPTPAALLCIRPGVYEQREPSSIDKVTTRPESFTPPQTQTASPLLTPAQKNATGSTNASSSLAELKAQPAPRPARAAFKQVRHLATRLFFLVLLCTLALTAVALASTEVNTYIFAVLHVDIRSGVALLVQFFRQFFS